MNNIQRKWWDGSDFRYSTIKYSSIEESIGRCAERRYNQEGEEVAVEYLEGMKKFWGESPSKVEFINKLIEGYKYNVSKN